MTDTELAIAVSVRAWPDELRRFLADHGGARVRLTAMSPPDLERESFDVLLIDDVCSYLTPALVAGVKRRGSAVLGVFDPSEYPDGKDRLLDCGVADVVDARAHPDEFLELIGRVRLLAPEGPVIDAPHRAEARRGATIMVIGSSGGVGVTEISAAIAMRIATRRRRCALVDLDLATASVAHRFDLDPHPNLLTAIDGLEGNLSEAPMQAMGPVSVLAGAPIGSHLGSLRPDQITGVLDWIRQTNAVVVIDAGSGGGSLASLFEDRVRSAELVVAIGSASPVGVARLIRRVQLVGRPVDLIINRAPPDSFRRGEIIEEVARSCQPRSLAFVPEDPGVSEAAWAGKPLKRGRFVRAVDRWVDTYAAGVVA